MFRKSSLGKKIIIGASLGLLIISLTQPAFYTANDSSDSLNLSSLGIFFLGWMGFLGGVLESFFWFANPLYLLAIYRFSKRKKNALVPSIAASIIAICFLFLDTFIKNEGGARTPITGFGLGYILWVASLSVLTLGILWYKRTNTDIERVFKENAHNSSF